jgi:hypothetical protein
LCVRKIGRRSALRHDKPARHVVKQSRWLPLRNQESLREDHAVRLLEVRRSTSRWPRSSAQGCFEGGLARAQRAGCLAGAGGRGCGTPGRAAKCRDSVLPATCTSVCRKGGNSPIKVIKRMAYGFRDSDYFFLKIKAAFPRQIR